MIDENTPIEELIALRRERYNNTKSMYCRILKEEVFFNNKGFYHATHDGQGKIRAESDARMRLHLLPWIYRVIKKSKNLGEPIRIIPEGHPENKLGKDIEFHEIYWEFNPRKVVSVILRRIGRGDLHYYSVRYTRKQNRLP